MNSPLSKFTRFAFAALAFGLLALAGCNTEPVATIIGPCSTPTNGSGDSETTIGSRLRPYELVANDGTVAVVTGPFLASWYDSKFGVPCAFRSIDGGDELLCLPAAIIASPNTYGDAACTQEVALVDACPKRPKYASVAMKDACWPVIAAIRPLGDPLPIVALYRLENGVCVPGTAVDDAHEALPVGAPMAWSDFVAATQLPKMD